MSNSRESPAVLNRVSLHADDRFFEEMTAEKGAFAPSRDDGGDGIDPVRDDESAPIRHQAIR